MSDNIAAEMLLIRRSGLFLSSWYISARPKAIAQGDDGAEHFCQLGWRQGAKPNPYFDPGFYLTQNQDVAATGVNPLVHYIAFGEAEGRDPCGFFHVTWYRQEYGLGPQESCLRHYLERRLTGQVAPVPGFDAAFYLETHRDVAAGKSDPFEHFLAFGPAEGRDPAPGFDIKYYMKRYADTLAGQNPLLHYLRNPTNDTRRPEHEGKAPVAVKRATRPSPHFEEFAPLPAHVARRAKLLAFYLPQFHRVAENEAWWGKGFTDWTNLARAQPRFTGHLQPRVPRDLGYYSLDDPSVLHRQVEMAIGAGLSGFVFYYYWFNRHRLLEKPLQQFLDDKSLKFSFCVMWANENWTRRWDGLEREILIAQEYLVSDDEALLASFAELFADPRYIRIDGRPLLMIYRPGLIPDARVRLAKWRAMFLELHGENPIIIMAQSLGDDYDSSPYELDGAVEFPPHKLSQETRVINAELDLLDEDFAAKVHDYQDIAETSLRLPPPDYPLIKTIVPGWDNDPRREGAGLALHGATPAKYQAWLEKLVDYAGAKTFFGERIICVNAWNEWAEGAMLEPDLHFGAAFLNATGRAMTGRAGADSMGKILLVGHDAQPHGSQLLLLHMARHLKSQAGMDVQILLLGVGPLLGKFFESGPVTVASDKGVIGHHLDHFKAAGYRTAIVNSAASAHVVPWLQRRGMDATLLIHELPQILQEYNLEISGRQGASAAKNLVFSSEFVAEKFLAAVDLKRPGYVILPQGNYQKISFESASRTRISVELGLGQDEFLVLGAGFGHIRKGFDFFLQIARRMIGPKIHFVWVGDIEFLLKTYLAPEMQALQKTGRFHHIPFTDDVQKYFSAADVFALTSREDPYPTVVMEALAAGVPCVAFEGSGGIPGLLRAQNAGLVAEAGDVDDFCSKIEALLDHEALAETRPRLTAMAEQKFDFGHYVQKLLLLAKPDLKTVSVCVLNYNYANYLPERLRSIFAQTYPVAEILFFDDASTDDSLSTAQSLALAARRDIKTIVNDRNSGSVFAQWRRAAETATGTYIWLCEADDAAHPAFLAQMMQLMTDDPEIVLAFSDSEAMDAAGRKTMVDYKSYYLQSGAPDLTRTGIWPADEFAAKFLWERNLIPNVSAVIWRRDRLLAALAAVDDLYGWRIAGDWRLYLAACLGGPGKIAFLQAPLNQHRRHEAGLTQSLEADLHVNEIIAMQEHAASALGLSATKRKAQHAYAAAIALQLGVEKKPASPPKREVARKKRL
jgi:glycosyltransferase involved in cell wall biosynthesis